VPFRLTRNLQSFFTAYGIEGLFIASLGATAQALTAPHSPLEHQLTLFFRDELMTHQLRPQRPGPDGGAPPPRPSLATMVQDNVQQVRLAALMHPTLQQEPSQIREERSTHFAGASLDPRCHSPAFGPGWCAED
jgi:phosphatidylinositol kinase/protein kinase (PI-3  family)